MIDIEEFIELYNSKLQGTDNINIFEFVELFNNRYKDFLLDYSNLKELGLSEVIDFRRYSKVDNYNIENVELELFSLKEPINNQRDALGLVYTNDKNSGIVLSNLWAINYPEERFTSFLKLDDSVRDSYLDIGRKHADFIDAYRKCRKGCLVCKDNVRLFTRLYDDEDVRFINNLHYLSLGLSIFENDEHHFIEFVFGLNDNYGDVKVSECSLGSQEYKLDDDSIIHILSSINISRELLPNLFKQQEKTRKREVK